MSTIAVAEKIDVSESTYRRYETDNSFPDIYTLDKIAKLYKKDFTELLPDEMVIINSEQKGGSSTNAYIINNLSEKLIEQYEARINELKEQVIYWKAKAKK